MTDEEREPCLKSLFENDSYKIQANDEETVKNMVERYEDIAHSFPEELNKEALPYFIDWFVKNVVIVQITAYSDENAYTIFETMNDRGLNLSPTEMLKGYVLSRVSDTKQRTELNELWKEQIKILHEYGKTADLGFFQSWFRGKYAESIRPGKAGSENKDFELIGSRFHNWFKDNHKELFKLNTSDDFYSFFKNEFPFYVKWYIKCKNSQLKFNKELPHLHYINSWGIGDSLQDPLLLSSIKIEDEEGIIKRKLDFTARFIEIFTVRRSVNYKKFGQASIKYTMFTLIKLIRNNDLDKLGQNLLKETSKIEQKWNAIDGFGLHGQNRKFVKHLLSRISSHLDTLIGKDNNYVSYHHPEEKQFEIEHLWGNKFNEHKEEFKEEWDFQNWRNSIGALVLLPNGTNQSFNSDKYEDKIEHYQKENTYAQTLTEIYYEKNPNFLKSELINALEFKPHPELKKEDIAERKELVQRICEQIWTTKYYRTE